MRWSDYDKNPLMMKPRQRKAVSIVVNRTDLVQAGYEPAKDEHAPMARYFRPPVSEIQKETARLERQVEKEFDAFISAMTSNPDYYGITPDQEAFMVSYYQTMQKIAHE